MEKFNERLIKKAEKIYKKYEHGLLFFQDAKELIREVRNQAHDEFTDQSLFEIESDLDELFIENTHKTNLSLSKKEPKIKKTS